MAALEAATHLGASAREQCFVQLMGGRVKPGHDNAW
jgi:hypothetical protein